jgi:hypothetical protein
MKKADRIKTQKDKIRKKEKKLAEQKKFLQERAINHSIQRAKERYNLDLDKSDIKKIGAMIVNGDIGSMEYGSDHTSLFVKLVYKETRIRVIYDVKINTVVTFLPFIQDKENKYYIKNSE